MQPPIASLRKILETLKRRYVAQFIILKQYQLDKRGNTIAKDGLCPNRFRTFEQRFEKLAISLILSEVEIGFRNSWLQSQSSYHKSTNQPSKNKYDSTAL